jgi:uncharacterized protein
MILVDSNLLLYAHDSLSEFHAGARQWWDAQLSGTDPVCLSWPVVTAFIRIGTNARLQRRPMTLQEAIDRIESWLSQPCVRVVSPTEHHWDILRGVLRESNAIGNLVYDAHLAALALEHNCELNSSDQDFSRFRGLKWRNPLR